MRYFTRFAVAAVITLPFVTSAATAAELQAQTQALLAQVQALQARQEAVELSRAVATLRHENALLLRRLEALENPCHGA